MGVGDPVRRQRIPERPRDRLLADHRVEGLGPPLPRQHLVAHVALGDKWPCTLNRPRSPCDLSTEPAPVRYSHGTREGRLTVAPFRAWRGSTILAAWGPSPPPPPRPPVLPKGQEGSVMAAPLGQVLCTDPAVRLFSLNCATAGLNP